MRESLKPRLYVSGMDRDVRISLYPRLKEFEKLQRTTQHNFLIYAYSLHKISFLFQSGFCGARDQTPLPVLGKGLTTEPHPQPGGLGFVICKLWMKQTSQYMVVPRYSPCLDCKASRACVLMGLFPASLLSFSPAFFLSTSLLYITHTHKFLKTLR